MDEDILYKASGSTEAQEAAHTRIINETPKLKINRAFSNVDETFSSENIKISQMRESNVKFDQRQSSKYVLGKSSYSSDNTPGIQLSMLSGEIDDSTSTSSPLSGSSIHIPQINFEVTIDINTKNVLTHTYDETSLVTETQTDGKFFEVSYEDMIMEIKEFGSFYEKENFEIEAFISGSDGVYTKLKFPIESRMIVDDLLVEEDQTRRANSFGEPEQIIFTDNSYLRYYFNLEFDEAIPRDELCKVVQKIEIIDHFLDSELECPDLRTDRFDIYSTRVGPEDLEDCDDV